MLLAALGKSLLSGRKKKKSKSGKEMSQQVLNRSNKEEEKPTIKPQSSLVPLSIKTTTIPTANLTTTKEDSVKDKLLMIKDLLGLQLKFRLSSFSQKIKNMREERRKKREKELEENKEKKKKSSFLNILPKTGILDSLKNFLAFLAGGFLLNILLNNLPVLEGIGKKLAPIAKGVMQFGKFMWDGVIGFIVNAYDKYDELRESIKKIGGEDALDKFDKVSDLLKKVINGALIMAAIALVAKPFMPKGPGGKGPGGVGGGTLICNCPLVPVTIPQLVRVTLTTLQTIIAGSLIPGAAELLRKLLEGLTLPKPVDLPVIPPVVEVDIPVDLPVDQEEFQKLYERAVNAVNTLSAAEKQFLIDNGFEDLIKGSIKGDIFGELTMLGASYAVVQGSILGLSQLVSSFGKLTMPSWAQIPAVQAWAQALLAAGSATALTPVNAAVNAEEITNGDNGNNQDHVEYVDGEIHITVNDTVTAERPRPKITQWYDLEDEPDYQRSKYLYRENREIDFLNKNISDYKGLQSNTSYSNGSYGLITNNTVLIQPIIQEV